MTKKIPPWIFFVSEICIANLRAAKSPSMAPVIQIKNEKSMDFSGYRRFATQFYTLLSRPSMGSLLVGKEEKNPAPVTLSRLVSLSNHGW